MEELDNSRRQQLQLDGLLRKGQPEGLLQRLSKDEARFGRTANGHLMVIMKIRPAREINEAVLNEKLKSMGLTLLCTLQPTR